ncbi:MAG: DUF3426 domain-containing protein [Rhizomicrobium sp.]|jgi:predicted Zn finger-like uncharacterized protein
MILTCPQCATRYQTDSAQFGAAGRKVRCAKCGHVWHQAPEAALEPEPVFAPIEDVEPPPASHPHRAAYAPPHEFTAPSDGAAPAFLAAEDAPRIRVDIAGALRSSAPWAALAAFVFVIGWSAVRFRQDIAIVWPQTATFYRAIGKPVNTTGLAVKDLSYKNESENGQEVLAITGRVTNVTTHELTVPPIRVTLTDDDRRVVYDWSFSAGVATLAGGKSVAFVTKLASPPSTARHAQVQVAGNIK